MYLLADLSINSNTEIILKDYLRRLGIMRGFKTSWINLNFLNKKIG